MAPTTKSTTETGLYSTAKTSILTSPETTKQPGSSTVVTLPISAETHVPTVSTKHPSSSASTMSSITPSGGTKEKTHSTEASSEASTMSSTTPSGGIKEKTHSTPASSSASTMSSTTPSGGIKEKTHSTEASSTENYKTTSVKSTESSKPPST